MKKPINLTERNSSGFPQTRWSLILDARNPSPEKAFEALEELCALYWPAVFAFLRRSGVPGQDAEDAAQGFFAHLLGQGSKGPSFPQKQGRFRSWLLACLRRYQIDIWRRESAARRGGGVSHISLDGANEQGDTNLQIADQSQSEESFDRCVAHTLVSRAFQLLEMEQRSEAARTLYPYLKPLLLENQPVGALPNLDEVAARFAISSGNVRKRRDRLRSRLVELLRKLAADLVPTDECVEDELRHLLKSLGH